MKLHPGGFWKAVFTPALLVSLFLTLTITNLDRFLPIHNDEIGILDPGHQLFHTGGYASRMYAGFQHQEIIYLEVMPQMPILQGLVTRLLGVGVFQLRIIPSLAGAATVTLTYLVANKLSKLGRENPRTRKTISSTAIVSLLSWQVAQPGMPFIASGIPLLDISRIARFDGLVPVFGLASFWLWIQAHETGNTRTYLLSGFCSGLAMLGHLYGDLACSPAAIHLEKWAKPHNQARAFWNPPVLIRSCPASTSLAARDPSPLEYLYRPDNETYAAVRIYAARFLPSQYAYRISTLPSWDAINPDNIIVQPSWLAWFAPALGSDGEKERQSYLDAHQAVLLADLEDNEGQPVQIYETSN